MTNKAMRLAYKAHQNQVDKGGIPYIFHPYHLAEQMNNEIRVCAALLHDVVEDTDVTIEQLKEEFPCSVTDILQLLTHGNGIDYYEYVAGICTNIDAAFVKLADLIHNMTEERLPDSIGDIQQDNDEKRQQWFQKYAKALSMVVHFLENHFYRGSEDEKLFYNIMKEYHGTKGKIQLHTDEPPLEYMTKQQYEKLKSLSIEQQAAYFRVEYTKSKKGGGIGNYSDISEIPLLKYLNQYKTLILADGCIVGVLDIDTGNRDCKEHVQSFYVGKRSRVICSRSYIDHSWDHTATVSTEEKVRLVWKNM